MCFALSYCHAACLGFLSLLGRDNLLLPGQLVYSSCTRIHRRSLFRRGHLDSEQGTPRPEQRRSLFDLVGCCNPYQDGENEARRPWKA